METNYSMEEELRRREDELLRQRMEEERLEQERLEAENKAAEEAASAAQDAVDQVETPSKPEQAAPATPNPAHSGVRSRGMGRVTAQDKKDAQFQHDVRQATLDTRFNVDEFGWQPNYREGMGREEQQSLYASNLVGHAMNPNADGVGNKISVDMGSIRNAEQAIGFMATLTTQEDMAKFAVDYAGKDGAAAFLEKAENYVYDKYGRNLFPSPYSSAAKNRAYTAGVQSLGLTGVDGQPLDPYKMTTADALLACRMDPSGETADAMYELAKAGAKIPGNPWYGQDVTKDMFKFVGSADLTKEDYDEEISAINESFTFSNAQGKDNPNLAVCAEWYAEIKSAYGDNPRVMGYFLRDMKKSFTEHTGLEAPPDALLEQILADTEAERESARSAEEEPKNGFQKAVEVIKGYFSREPAIDTNLPEAAPAEDGKETTGKATKTVEQIMDELKAVEDAKTSSGRSSASSVIASGGTTSVNGQEVRMSAPVASTTMPSTQDLFGETQTEEAIADGFDNPLGISSETLAKAKARGTAEVQGPVDQREHPPYVPEMTDAQAWMYQQAGYVLAPENYEQIKRFANNELSGLMTNEKAVSSGDPHVFRKHGSILGATAQAIATSGLTGEARADAELALMSLAADIYDMYSDPYNPIVRPDGSNMYDYAFSLDSALVDRNAAIMDSLKTAKGAYSENVVHEAEERQARLDGYAQSVMNNTGDAHMADALAEHYAGDTVDVYSDERYTEMLDTMSPWGDYFGEKGTFWQGESMAAQEVRNILTAGGKQGFFDFQNALYSRVETILSGYTTAAHNMGMTLDEFLTGSNIGGLDQIVDIAYNAIQAEGSAIAGDKQLQDAISAESQGLQGTAGVVFANNRLTTGDAIEHGVNTAWTDYKESFAHAAYTMMDLATYDATIYETKNDYRSRYGWQAEAMRRRDLNAVLESGDLSPEMADELRRDMSRAYSIFDVCYDIDANGLKGVARQSASELSKKLDLLNAVTATLEPDQQQLVRIATGISNNLISTGVQIGTTAAASILGAPAAVAMGVGSTVGFGVNIFDDAYKSNIHEQGMGRQTAAFAAGLEAAGMSAIENLNAGTLTGMILGDTAINGVARAARTSAKNFARAMFGRSLISAGGEGLEEALQTGWEHTFDILDTEFLAYERGEGISFSRALGTLERGLRTTDYEKLGKDMITSFGAGTAYGVVYALVGMPFSARAAFKDAHAYNQYESVKLATQIVEGELEANNENLGRVHAALSEDLEDPAFRRYIDRGSKQAMQSRHVMTALLEGTMLDTLDAATDHALKAKEYEKKADAAGKAVESSKGYYFSLREQVASGDLDKKTALESARIQWAKAETAYTEANNAAEKERNTAARSVNAWLDGCKERARTLSAEGMQVRMEQIANVRAGIAARLNALYNATEAARMALDRSDAIAQSGVDYAESAVFGEEAEIDEELSLMDDAELDEDIDALSAQIAEAEARIAEVSSRQEELGIDGETVQALTEQELAPLSSRRDRIIAREKARFNNAFERQQQALEMDNEDAADQIQVEYDGIAQRLQKLGVDVEALMMEQYGIDQNAANAAYEAEQEKETQRAEDERFGNLTDDLGRRMEMTNASLEAVNPARRYFAKNPIYVNEAQAADILSAEGLKSISQFNRRYGTKLTTRETDGAMPLDGHVLSDINAEAAGSVNVDGDPVAEMLTVLRRGKELTATQRAEKAEAKELEAEQKRVEAARRERVTDIVTGTTKEQRDAQKAEEQAQANVDAMDVETFIAEKYPDATEEQKAEIRKRWADNAKKASDEESKDITAFVARISKKFKVPIKFVGTLDGAEGEYDGKSILIARDATQGEIIRKVILHELTHKAEGSKLYGKLSKMILDMKYGGDQAQMDADIESTISRYQAFYDKKGRKDTFTKENAKQEIVADFMGEMLDGNQEMIDRLVADEPSVAQRIVDTLKGAINTLRGVKDAEIDKMRKAVRLFERALKKAKKTSGKAQNSIPVQTEAKAEALEETVKFSLPSGDALDAEIRAWRASHQAQIDAAITNDGVSKFAEDTVQRAERVPVDVKQEFATNPLLRTYAKDTNEDQLKRAQDNIEQNGYENEVERLLDADYFTTDDNVEAGMIAISAFEAGDIATGLEMALKYRQKGTEQAQAFQSRKLFATMTPSHIALKVAMKAEQKLQQTIKNLPGKAKEVNKRAAEIDKELDSILGGDENQRARTESGYVVDAANVIDGRILNEKQKFLIEKYGLGNVKPAGIHYNRATLKQRMLQAIIETPDPAADSGNGLTLTQRLEWMKEGKAVVTAADIRYIKERMQEYVKMDDTGKGTRPGDIALGRAFEAYTNITPPSLRERYRTARFVNMLLSGPSAMRNLMGNAIMNLADAGTIKTAGAFVDWLVGDKIGETGKHAHAKLTAEERANGWHAFVEEIGNTFRDYFVDQVDTSPRDQGEAKFDSQKRGRVFQSRGGHFAHMLEGFLMSFGDRTFYKRAYFNSLAEQARLAQENGTTLDWEAAVDQAKADADYATFNEDNFVRSALNTVKNSNPILEFVLDMYIPFVGVPTNIVKRGFFEYSPVGLGWSFIKPFIWKAQGRAFDQKAYVDGVARGLTGSVLVFLGYGLAALGVYHPGTSEEDDEKLYNLRAAQGAQYTPYIKVFDEYVSLGTFAPLIYPITIGATVYDLLKEDSDLSDAFVNAGVAMVNQLFDASFMSGLGDLFNTQNSTFGENLFKTLPANIINQSMPFNAVLGQIATATDEYVRDTKDASAIRQALKTAVSKIPGARQWILDPKYDIAGNPVEAKDGFVRNLIGPLSTTKVNDDPVLAELDRLYDVLGTSSHIPSYLVKTSGKVTILANIADDRRVNMDRAAGEHKLVLTANERNYYNRMYSQLCFEGTGDTKYERVGKVDTNFDGIRETMESRKYQRASDEEKASMISEIISKAKMLTHAQMVIDKGYMK